MPQLYKLYYPGESDEYRAARNTAGSGAIVSPQNGGTCRIAERLVARGPGPRGLPFFQSGRRQGLDDGAIRHHS